MLKITAQNYSRQLSSLHFISIYGYSFSINILKDFCDTFNYGQITVEILLHLQHFKELIGLYYFITFLKVFCKMSHN